ncbi:MAG: PepSY domain-containing protein [Hyphomicrobiales bacterium]|nr:PepSY domain-containing protein [Hyphomicrobiales bacterium]
MRVGLVVVLLAFATPALAGSFCTDAPPRNWPTKAEMMDRIRAMGHQISAFKTTDGNCYEIYGKDKSGKRVEVYFHSVTGKVVKSPSL